MAMIALREAEYEGSIRFVDAAEPTVRAPVTGTAAPADFVRTLRRGMIHSPVIKAALVRSSLRTRAM